MSCSIEFLRACNWLFAPGISERIDTAITGLETPHALPRIF